MRPACCLCYEDIERGGLLFGAPSRHDDGVLQAVTKRHLCVPCLAWVVDAIADERTRRGVT